MSLYEHVDVVVIGFGAAGAAAALAAVDRQMRVVVVDQGVPADRRIGRLRRGRTRAGTSTLRAAVRAAGVEVRPRCRVHELVMDAGTVRGVGYATLPPRGFATTGHDWLRRMSGLAPSPVAPMLTRAAESLWPSDVLVGEIACSAVVLALDPRHWEFVGPATWSAAWASRLGDRPAPAGAERAGVRPTPELEVRQWCASRDPRGAVPQSELRVDDVTGAVLVDDGLPVPGLYSAVRPDVGTADARRGTELLA